MFDFVASDPLLMHCAILLAANHFSLMGQVAAVPLGAFYYHKVEAIRMVNARLGNAVTATSTGTIGAVASLTILEVSSV